MFNVTVKHDGDSFTYSDARSDENEVLKDARQRGAKLFGVEHKPSDVKVSIKTTYV